MSLWVTSSLTDLAEKNKSHPDFSTALAMYDAIQNVAQRFGELYISDKGDIDVFLYIIAAPGDKKKTKLIASIVEPTAGEMKIARQTDAAGTRVICASFLCDYPDAVFTIDGGSPVCLLVEKTKEKSVLSLNVMKAAAAAGHRNFAIAVAGSAEDAEGAVVKSSSS